MCQESCKKKFDQNKFANCVSEGTRNFQWRYFIYCSCVFVKEFFWGPKRNDKDDIEPLKAANDLLIAGNANDENTIKCCERLVALHRQNENTKARRRLERWATRVITIYLIAISVIFFFSYVEDEDFCLKLVTPDPVMEFLLTTTTVNVIGLVVIVLKGYFEEKSSKNTTT